MLLWLSLVLAGDYRTRLRMTSCTALTLRLSAMKRAVWSGDGVHVSLWIKQVELQERSMSIEEYGKIAIDRIKSAVERPHNLSFRSC